MRAWQVTFGRRALTVFMLVISWAVRGEAQRSVDGTILTSAELPAVVLRLDSILSYVGVQQFAVGAADAEQYLFVESEGPRIRRLYWIQFEGYRDAWRSYDYSADPTIDLGGRAFHINDRYYPASGFAGPPGSDGARALQLLERGGYELPPDLGRVRLVWLWDDTARHELMIIYVEDLARRRLTVQDLHQDPSLWEQFRAGLLDRALAGMTLSRSVP
jgi:hypothetical protein